MELLPPLRIFFMSLRVDRLASGTCCGGGGAPIGCCPGARAGGGAPCNVVLRSSADVDAGAYCSGVWRGVPWGNRVDCERAKSRGFPCCCWGDRRSKAGDTCCCCCCCCCCGGGGGCCCCCCCGGDEIGIARIVSSSSAGGISKDGDAVQRGERGLLLVFQLRLLGTGGVKGFFGERGGIGGRG